jgi:hypothetical protein
MNKNIVPLLALSFWISACAAERRASSAEQAMSRAQAAIVELTAERNHYQDLAAVNAIELKRRVRASRADVEAAFAAGVRVGHDTVKCAPSWPALEAHVKPDGRTMQFKVLRSTGAP